MKEETVSLSSSDVRFYDVPSIEDLERIEQRLDVGEQLDRRVRDHLASELVKRLAENDERLGETSESLIGTAFQKDEYHGRIDDHFGEVISTIFDASEYDIHISTAMKIAGASSMESYAEHEWEAYTNAMESAGFETDNWTDEDLHENSNAFLEEVGYEDIDAEINSRTTREAYEEVVSGLLDYME